MKPLPSLFKRKLANLLFSARFYERVSHEDGVFGSNFVSPHFKSNYSSRQKPFHSGHHKSHYTDTCLLCETVPDDVGSLNPLKWDEKQLSELLNLQKVLEWDTSL